MQLLTINEAAGFAGKSIQTIRRIIKKKKIRVKRQKTPQGFNYLIVRESLVNFLNRSQQAAGEGNVDIQHMQREHRGLTEDSFKTEVEHFNTTIQQLIARHEKDKEHLFQLIKTFQERNTVLEERIKLLEAPKSRWWKFWR